MLSKYLTLASTAARRMIFITFMFLGHNLVALPVLAQSDDEVASRYPATGVAVLDCAPKIEAITDTCVLRVPPSQERENLRVDLIGDGDGKFEFLAPSSERFPRNVTFSETIILIDLAPGPGGARRATFATEQRLIRQFVQSLPAGENIAVYGFNEQMIRLANFSRDRDVALSVIDNLELTGTNTRIATFTKEAIEVLNSRKNTLFKNVFIISDGDEEGQRDTAGVTKAAINAGVSISALGMFWRPVGAVQTGAGMDYLSNLTVGTLGRSEQLQLRRAAEARQTLIGFQQAVSKSIRGSGIIVAKGEPQEAVIIVTMKKPTIGVSGSFTEEEIRVRFTPVSAVGDAATTDDEAPEIVDEALIFGYPAMWIYVAGAAFFGLLLLLLLLILRKSNSDASEEFDLDDFDDEPEANVQLTPAPVAKSKPQKVYAYLVDTGGRRLPVTASNASIGRSVDNTVTITDDSISRNHAQLTQTQNGDFRIVDLGSLNGTFVNGKKVTEKVALTSGDQIKFGEVETRLVLA